MFHANVAEMPEHSKNSDFPQYFDVKHLAKGW
jgi:hypothetical protein